MPEIYRLFVPGKPFGKQSVRAGKTFAYMPKKTVDYLNFMKLLWIQKYGNKTLPHEAYQVDAYCCFIPPKSTSKKRRELMLKGKILYTKKPDRDNIEKSIGDGLNGLAWSDDSYIVLGETAKVYREYQGVLIKITPIEEVSGVLLDEIDKEVELAEVK